MPPLTTCPDETFPAVELVLVDEAEEPVVGATLRYRVDGSEWQAWPENTGRRTVIRGRPGLYEIEVARQGFGSVSETLNVPALPEERCKPVPQAVVLQMARIPCPVEPEALRLVVAPPLTGLAVRADLPGSGIETLTCSETPGESCLGYSLLIDYLGPYQVRLDGLPGLGPMQVVSNVVAYDPPPVEITLEHRGQKEMVEVGGAEKATLTFEVRRDESNCALADLRALEVKLEPDPSDGGQPPLAVSYHGSLTMTDLGAAACRTEPVLTPLPFAVDLPAGTDLADVELIVDYGEGWVRGVCEFEEGPAICQVLVPNPLLDRPFAVRVKAAGEEATGMQLPFSGMCLIFD